MTRNSVIPGNFVAPYNVIRFVVHNNKLLHMTMHCDSAEYVVTCCRNQLNPPHSVFSLETAPTCLLCVACHGCPACRDRWITDATMRLGKWVTHDQRRLYPFEMDDTHLTNSIKKLIRDEHHFKDDWREWVTILRTEARQRGLL